MNRDETLSELLRLAAAVLPGVQAEVCLCDAGGFWLDLDWSGRWFEIEWQTGRGFGVSESDAGTLPFTGHDFACTTLGEVRSRLLALRGSPATATPEPTAVS